MSGGRCEFGITRCSLGAGDSRAALEISHIAVYSCMRVLLVVLRRHIQRRCVAGLGLLSLHRIHKCHNVGRRSLCVLCTVSCTLQILFCHAASTLRAYSDSDRVRWCVAGRSNFTRFSAMPGGGASAKAAGVTDVFSPDVMWRR